MNRSKFISFNYIDTYTFPDMLHLVTTKNHELIEQSRSATIPIVHFDNLESARPQFTFGSTVKVLSSGLALNKKGGILRSGSTPVAKKTDFWVVGENEIEIVNFDKSAMEIDYVAREIAPLDAREGESSIEELRIRIGLYLANVDNQIFADRGSFFDDIKSIETLLNAAIHVLMVNGQISDSEIREYISCSEYARRYDYVKSILTKSEKNLKEKRKNYAVTDKTSKYAYKIEQLAIPQSQKEELLKIASHASGSGSKSNANDEQYLETVCSIPFGEFSQETRTVVQIRKALEESEFGLEKAKDRILEYLAVKKHTGDKIKAPILCLVGPPGVGKTFFAKNLAKALGREYISIGLGGLDSVGIIKGEQRAYIGGAPGLIIRSLIRSKVMNPVFVLDELDKVGVSWQGKKVIGALHEILDPNQNYEFTDDYVQLPVDISKILFIATANYIEDIPYSLRDRLEVIELEAYSKEEKTVIAQKYLWPRLLFEHGLKDDEVKLSNETLHAIIESHLGEPGIRSLERSLAAIVRKCVLYLELNELSSIVINTDNIKEFWTDKPDHAEKIDTSLQLVGTVLGMVVKSVDSFETGGGLMKVQVQVVKGSGRMQMTGSLGEIFRESGVVAFAYVRKNAASLGIDELLFLSTDIIIHLPTLSMKKDGPSATAAIAIALISAFTGRPVLQNIAITGEMDLEGNILPVGGIKNKISGSYKLGLKEFVIPDRNGSDLDELPPEVRENIVVYRVKTMNEAIEHYFSNAVNDL